MVVTLTDCLWKVWYVLFHEKLSIQNSLLWTPDLICRSNYFLLICESKSYRHYSSSTSFFWLLQSQFLVGLLVRETFSLDRGPDFPSLEGRYSGPELRAPSYAPDESPNFPLGTAVDISPVESKLLS